MKSVTLLAFATSVFAVTTSAAAVFKRGTDTDVIGSNSTAAASHDEIDYGGQPGISGNVTKADIETPAFASLFCWNTTHTLTPEEEVQLAVLFGDSSEGTTFADYVVSYASELVDQIDYIADIAVGDNNYNFTTAFDTIDIPGVLGLASAAPIYSCYLSSLWAQALANPQQYAKLGVPTEDDKIKLVVLFEKRESDDLEFNYAELLTYETENMLAEVEAIENVVRAAEDGSLADYEDLYEFLDVPYFLSLATQAPIYTEGLSAAFSTALESYSSSKAAHPV